MKFKIYCTLLLSIFLCASCVRYYGPRYKSNILFSFIEKQGWNLIRPLDKWSYGYKKEMLPQYFSYDQLSVQSVEMDNYFYATYRFDDNNSLALCINFPESFFIRQLVSGRGDDMDIKYTNNAYDCANHSTPQRVIIGANRIDVDFDNSFVYVIVKGKKIYGQELYDKRYSWFEAARIGHVVYNLGSEEIWKAKQPDLRYMVPFKHLSFYFVFDMTCTDYEDAIFVIDGLSRHGKKIPPLMVRMNYFDFSAVPEWQGEKAIQAQ